MDGSEEPAFDLAIVVCDFPQGRMRPGFGDGFGPVLAGSGGQDDA
jgi:hypothetical protein